jgi:hypothetical protein
MDLKKALDILEINFQDYSPSILKKKYYKMALRYHPDKQSENDNQGCTEKFKEINEAYTFLKNNNLEYNFENENTNENSFSYLQILKTFINNELLFEVISIIISKCQQVSLTLFEKLSKDKALELFTFLIKHKNILGLNEDILAEVKSIILEKYCDDYVFILNPSIDDLLSNNIYKLIVKGQTYYVPLWHDISYYDITAETSKEKKEMIIKCIPDLPEHISLDENLNIIIDINIVLNYNIIQENKDFFITYIGKRVFKIPYNELQLKAIQYYVFYGCGVSLNKENIMICEPRSDVCFRIRLVPFV